MVSGYLHAKYPETLAEFGTPRLLPNAQGWMLERQTVSGARDAMGCYPLFCCVDWNRLSGDLEDLRTSGELVSLVAIADPLAQVEQDDLETAFRDVVRPFKSHHVCELHVPRAKAVDASHQRKARRALERVSVEISDCPRIWSSDWIRLYGHLIARHAISGMPAFSTASLSGQLEVPGAVAFRAIRDGDAVAMLVFYEQESNAYYHLGASSPDGYEVNASFALFWEALEHFAARGLKWLLLGAGSGSTARADDGLSRFKRGWATTTRTAYLCGAIFDPQTYAALAQARNIPETKYFPAYRAGEFA